MIIMTFAAFFSFGYVHQSLVLQEDGGVTFQRIQSSNLLFKAEILGWVVILISDIAVAWAFYIFLKPINRHLSLLGAWFRLTYAAILGIAISNLLIVTYLTDHANQIPLLPAAQLHAQTMLHLAAFESIWSVGLIIFGVHLLIVGYIFGKRSESGHILEQNAFHGMVLRRFLGYRHSGFKQTFVANEEYGQNND